VDFAELVESESRGLVAAVEAIVGDRGRAEDIAQEAFERCYVRWRRVAQYDRPGAWVHRVAINAAISSLRRTSGERRAWQRVAGFAAPAPADPTAGLDDAGIWSAVRALPGEQAAALALRYAADLSIEDIAAAMRLTAPAVKSLLHRGRSALRSSGALRAFVG
jgi:RNA polymerase sigma factor (sigma-70 family)